MQGKRLGPYEIETKLGEGGMGEVYLASDTRLGRKVAIKILPDEYAGDADRLARFELEARAAAALNHPHIAGVHDIGVETGTHFIVQEYLEGTNLRERIESGRLPLVTGLTLAAEVAEALAVAHGAGIAHLDLKPENLFVTEQGHARVLDFGLAKLTERAAPAGIGATQSPTMLATPSGQMTGTAGYMAPEQITGEGVDERADIFAFGCVLYETVTGQRAFGGKNLPEVLHRLANEDPIEITEIEPSLPAELGRIVHKCLAKEAGRRYQGAADLALDLRTLIADIESGRAGRGTSGPEATKPMRSWLALAVAGVVGLLLGAGFYGALSPSTTTSETRIVRFSVPAPEGHVLVRGLAVSPDGSKVALTLRNPGGRTEIWVRSLETLEMMRIPGTEGSTRFPFWSPEGTEVGFFTEYELRAADLIGSPPRTLVSGLGQGHDARGGTWGADGTIVYAPTYIGGLMRVPATGGEPEPATVLDPTTNNGTHRFPSFLPDGRHFVFYASTGSGAEPGEIRLGELGSTVSRRLTASSSAAVFAPPNHLLFTRGDALVTQKIDLDTLETIGDPLPLDIELPGGLSISGLRSLSTSSEGTLVYLVDDLSWTRMEWVDREGNLLGEIEDPETWHFAPRISPDGKTVAVTRYAEDTDGGDIWLFDRERGLGTPFVTGAGDADLVAWSPDGQRLGYSVTKRNSREIMIRPLDGPAELIAETDAGTFLDGWTPDGSGLIIEQAIAEHGGGSDLAILSLAAPAEPAREVKATQYAEWDGSFSPDGRWFLYASDVTGRKDVYVIPADGSQLVWQVSTAGGAAPRWSYDGTEIFYVSIDDWMHAARVTATDRFSTAAPERLFQAYLESEPGDRQWDLAPDGAFLLNRRSKDASNPVTVVLGLNKLLEP